MGNIERLCNILCDFQKLENILRKRDNIVSSVDYVAQYPVSFSPAVVWGVCLSPQPRVSWDKKAEKEFIVEFIEMYRGLPALWDVKCKDYTSRAKNEEQYDVLIEKYREKYPDAEKQVVKKINSLRTNFRKELNGFAI